MSKRVLGILMVVLSAYPMGTADGYVLDGQKLRGTLLTILGFGIYWAGFLLAPKDLGLIIGIWEFSAVSVAYLTVFGLQGALDVVKTPDFILNFAGMVAGVLIMVFFSYRVFGLLPSEA